MNPSIVIFDFGSQTTQLIARRVRELEVYCEVFRWDTPEQRLQELDPAGIILSGSPASVNDENAPTLPAYALQSGKPVLGICYGMQLLARALGGEVSSAEKKEFGMAEIIRVRENPLVAPGSQPVWMSHGDQVTSVPPGFDTLAMSGNTRVAAMGDLGRRLYGVQFHPEVRHSPGGMELLRAFVLDICNARADWTPQAIIADAVSRIQRQVGNDAVLSAVSGGVDSTVATALVHRAVGSQLRAVFVNTGLLRLNEAGQVESVLKEHLGIPLSVVDASAEYFKALKGVTEPEEKRRVIGGKFIEVFTREAARAGNPAHLVQGTIYPDVIESSQAGLIKSHHNVGGLPKEMKFQLVEPLRYLFKDEVRRVGEALGIPAQLVWRQPFPGPGLAVRCLGEVTEERVERLQLADAIFIEELQKAGLINLKPEPGVARLAQAFVALLPVRSVGVMGDRRTYHETAALRAVTTEDFMTADWARLPYELLGRVANRIVNEVPGINRVVYDITSKPPATIEWE